MKTETPDPLLRALLDDAAAFQQSTLAQTIVLARQRRHRRFAIRALTVAALFAGVAMLLRPPTPAPAPKPLAIAEGRAVRIIRSTPLPAGQFVRTNPALFSRTTSVPGEVAVVTSQLETIARIETTTSAPMLDYLNDQQLLAAFPGQHPALIAPGTAEARLVFY